MYVEGTGHSVEYSLSSHLSLNSGDPTQALPASAATYKVILMALKAYPITRRGGREGKKMTEFPLILGQIAPTDKTAISTITKNVPLYPHLIHTLNH